MVCWTARRVSSWFLSWKPRTIDCSASFSPPLWSYLSSAALPPSTSRRCALQLVGSSHFSSVLQVFLSLIPEYLAATSLRQDDGPAAPRHPFKSLTKASTS